MKAHRRKVNMKLLFRNETEKKCEGKNFRGACAKCFIVMYISICAQHAKIYPIEGEFVYTRSFRKRKKFFLHYFLMEYSWEPCFPMECSPLWNVFVESPTCISLVSCVVQWKANIFYFSHSFIFHFREYHSQFPCCVYIFSHPQTQNARKESKARGRKENSRQNEAQGRKENGKSFPTLNAFSKLLLRFFSFSLHSLSVVCEHFIDLEQPNNICCSSRPIIHSLSLTHSPRIF